MVKVNKTVLNETVIKWMFINFDRDFKTAGHERRKQIKLKKIQFKIEHIFRISSTTKKNANMA